MIEYLEIKLVRSSWADGHQELDITVSVDGVKHHAKRIVPPDDLSSFFERIWDTTGRELSSAIKEYKKNNGVSQ